MNLHKTVHPWRTRTREFAKHLTELPTAEAQRLKEAERQYIAQCETPNGRRHAAERDYVVSMVGTRDEVDEE